MASLKSTHLQNAIANYMSDDSRNCHTYLNHIWPMIPNIFIFLYVMFVSLWVTDCLLKVPDNAIAYKIFYSLKSLESRQNVNLLVWPFCWFFFLNVQNQTIFFSLKTVNANWVFSRHTLPSHVAPDVLWYFKDSQ